MGTNKAKTKMADVEKPEPVMSRRGRPAGKAQPKYDDDAYSDGSNDDMYVPRPSKRARKVDEGKTESEAEEEEEEENGEEQEEEEENSEEEAPPAKKGRGRPAGKAKPKTPPSKGRGRPKGSKKYYDEEEEEEEEESVQYKKAPKVVYKDDIESDGDFEPSGDEDDGSDWDESRKKKSPKKPVGKPKPVKSARTPKGKGKGRGRPKGKKGRSYSDSEDDLELYGDEEKYIPRPSKRRASQVTSGSELDSPEPASPPPKKKDGRSANRGRPKKAVAPKDSDEED